eukprot:335853-Rhodomonas_salina.2
MSRRAVRERASLAGGKCSLEKPFRRSPLAAGRPEAIQDRLDSVHEGERELVQSAGGHIWQRQRRPQCWTSHRQRRKPTHIASCSTREGEQRSGDACLGAADRSNSKGSRATDTPPAGAEGGGLEDWGAANEEEEDGMRRERMEGGGPPSLQLPHHRDIPRKSPSVQKSARRDRLTPRCVSRRRLRSRGRRRGARRCWRAAARRGRSSARPRAPRAPSARTRR